FSWSRVSPIASNVERIAMSPSPANDLSRSTESASPVSIIQRVAGLILLDASHEEPYGRLADLMRGNCPDNAVRAEPQAKLARLSPRARQVIAEWSGHFIE